MRTVGKDFTMGDAAELYVAGRIKKPINTVSITQGNDNSYNIIQTTTLEVKFDEKSLETDNQFIEFKCNGHPSGIEVTTANKMVFVNTKVVRVIPTLKLKEMLARTSFKTGEHKSERGMATGWLIPVKMIEENSAVSETIMSELRECGWDEKLRD